MNTNYAHAKTLTEALKICRQELERSGKSELLPFLRESSVRTAILTGLKSYDAVLRLRRATDIADQFAYFRETVIPVFRSIAQENVWPGGGRFFFVNNVSDDMGIAYESFGLRLEVPTPAAQNTAFSLPVLDIYFGRLFPDTDEAVLALELQLERVRTEAEQSWRAKDYILTTLLYEEIQVHLTPEELSRLGFCKQQMG